MTNARGNVLDLNSKENIRQHKITSLNFKTSTDTHVQGKFLFITEKYGSLMHVNQ